MTDKIKKRKSEISMEIPHQSKIGEVYFSRPTSGFLFIGDPHIWSHKPGRRLDEDYLGTLLGKMLWAAEKANEQQLWPVILGDLLHDATDNNLVMISRLTDCLQHFDRKPLVLVGNHDLTEKKLTPGTTLHLLNQTGQILAMTNNGPYGIFEMVALEGKVRVLLGGTPYGEAIPQSLLPWVESKVLKKDMTSHDDLKKLLGVDEVVWITHEDLAFDKSYPNAITLAPILGVDVAVNGHMHTNQKPIMKGKTAWFNPGNISRLTIDLIEQIPTVWKWVPKQKEIMIGADGLPVPLLLGLIIPHVLGCNILSLEGRVAVVDDLSNLQEKVNEGADLSLLTSSFVDHIKNETHVGRSDDGVFLSSVIKEEMSLQKTPQHIKDIVDRLFEKAINKHRNL